MSGRLEQIWTKRFHRGPMEPVSTARLHVGCGLADNADLGGKRQITLISRERWEIVTNAMDVVLDPILRRANLLVSGINLQESRNRVIRIGPCRIRLVGETRPCERMDLVHPGLCAALGHIPEKNHLTKKSDALPCEASLFLLEPLLVIAPRLWGALTSISGPLGTMRAGLMLS